MLKDKSREVIIEVTQEEYDAQLASGLTEDEVLKPGRHVFRRGGFLERHPNFSLENIEIIVTNDDQETRTATENVKDKKAA